MVQLRGRASPTTGAPEAAALLQEAPTGRSPPKSRPASRRRTTAQPGTRPPWRCPRPEKLSRPSRHGGGCGELGRSSGASAAAQAGAHQGLLGRPAWRRGEEAAAGLTSGSGRPGAEQDEDPQQHHLRPALPPATARWPPLAAAAAAAAYPRSIRPAGEGRAGETARRRFLFLSPAPPACGLAPVPTKSTSEQAPSLRRTGARARASHAGRPLGRPVSARRARPRGQHLPSLPGTRPPTSAAQPVTGGLREREVGAASPDPAHSRENCLAPPLLPFQRRAFFFFHAPSPSSPDRREGKGRTRQGVCTTHLRQFPWVGAAGLALKGKAAASCLRPPAVAWVAGLGPGFTRPSSALRHVWSFPPVRFPFLCKVRRFSTRVHRSWAAGRAAWKSVPNRRDLCSALDSPRPQAGTSRLPRLL